MRESERSVRDEIKTIWNGVLNGNSSAWYKLVKKYTPLVLSVARRAGLRQTDAEDCAQLTWVTLYKSRHIIKEPEKISSWLTRVTTRKVSDMLKKMSRDMRGVTQNPTEVAPRLPDEELLEWERDLQLELALEQLNPQCQKLLRAFFYSADDKSYRDVAKELAITQNSLGPARMRCLRKLKRILVRTGYPWLLFP